MIQKIKQAFKVQLFWEGHKNVHNRPDGFDIYLVNVKTIGTIVHIFVVFSEKLNFTENHKDNKRRLETVGIQIIRCWLSQFSWDSQQGSLRTTSILVRAFWNFKCKVLKYSRICSLHNTFIPNLVKPLMYIVHLYWNYVHWTTPNYTPNISNIN